MTGRKRWLVSAPVLAVFMAGGIAYATIPAPDGVISACYGKSGGTVRVIDSAVTKCGRNETSLDWNRQGPKGDPGPPGPKGDPGDPASASEAYHEIGAPNEPSFENGWANRGDVWSTTGFYRDPMGVVHLKGNVAGGPNGTVAFSLPPGYRPDKRLFLPAASHQEFDASAVVWDTGEVFLTVGAGGATIVGIDGLTFRAGA
jgi:hypothetical protein